MLLAKPFCFHHVKINSVYSKEHQIIFISYNNYSAENPNSDALTSSHYSQYSNTLFRTLHPLEGRAVKA